jgi:hypothetical protein
MASDWNRLLERLLEAPLTVNEYRLAIAIARQTLGYRRREGDIGRKHLQKLSGVTDGRGFARALEGLVEAGIVSYTSGGRGRGRRSHYELLLGQEKSRSRAAFSDGEKMPLSRTKKAAPARPLRGNRREKQPSKRSNKITTKAAEAYLEAGGSLDLDEWRGALVRQASTLAKRGVSERTILAAAHKLGRERGFPGYLAQRAEAIEESGGPCSWEGLDHSRLTIEQLGECACKRCSDWLTHRLEAVGTS